MAYRIPSKEEKGINSASPKADVNGSYGKSSYSSMEDLFNSAEDMMNFDAYAGWCPLTSEEMPELYSLLHMSTDGVAVNPLSFTQQSCDSFCVTDTDVRTSIQTGDTMMYEQTNFVLDTDDCRAISSSDSCQQNNTMVIKNSSIPRPFQASVAEKMVKALSLFMESFGCGILAQLWVPVMDGDHLRLSTCEQPYLLDHMLAGYRDISRRFTFSAEVKPGSSLGLPGRVFASKIPEWTSNVVYYSKDEYLRVHHAVENEVRGLVALPIFSGNPHEISCSAVLELVSLTEKADFDLEMEHVCHALAAVDLRSTTLPRFSPQCLSNNHRAALAEITDVLRTLCHAYMLPLALTWIPCNYNDKGGNNISTIRVRGDTTNTSEKCILCIEDTACYVNDEATQRFVHACAEHYLEEGQGTAGKALQSNHPFFSSDVKEYDISDYPLVHHARKFGFSAVVAIRLRSTYTQNDDYILEFFLPRNMTGSTQQQLLLNNLSNTMQRICRTLRRVSHDELLEQNSPLPGIPNGSFINSPTLAFSSNNSQHELSNSIINSGDQVQDSVHMRMVTDDSVQQATNRSRRVVDKKRSSAERYVSLTVLQQYFSGSLKDAAKSIGVCPTTLKRICRQHGISRWPSRKINKVNRSLKKIQTVLRSVGVEGGLKIDTSTGSVVKSGNGPNNSNIRFSDWPDSSTLVEAEPYKPFSPSMYCGGSENTSLGSYFSRNDSKICGLNLADSKSENYASTFVANKMYNTVNENNRMDDGDRVVELNQPTTSNMSDSSSASTTHGSSSSSTGFGEPKPSKIQICEGGSKITVKATYKEDTIRFKFDPYLGCLQLYEEVARRFKIQTGTFHLKYLDDENEWVMMVNESDLVECLEILDFAGSCNVKFQVHDTTFATGSSGSSNFPTGV